MIKISIIHPSYKRPQLAAKCAKMWLDRCKDKSRVEYLLCLSEKEGVDGLEKYCMSLGQYGEFFNDIRVKYCPEASYVAQSNFAAKEAKGNILVIIGDDFECPQDWDELLLSALEDKEDYVAKVQDGIQPFIMTMPIMDKKYYDRFGYALFPEYNHMYVDNEVAEVGRILGRTITLDILFQHNHYSVGKMEKDETNIKNDSFYGVDGETFMRRQSMNFGLN